MSGIVVATIVRDEEHNPEKGDVYIHLEDSSYYIVISTKQSAPEGYVMVPNDIQQNLHEYTSVELCCISNGNYLSISPGELEEYFNLFRGEITIIYN